MSEVSWCQDESRIYTHRFVLLNDKFEITKLSDPWYFENHGIEFCRGMCVKKGELIITCGIKDEEAWCYVCDIKEVMVSMKELSTFTFNF